MATINEMRQVATQIENETQVGGNTASRVGGLFNDVVDKLEEVETINANDVVYDNTQSGLAANNVQGALDETISLIGDKTSIIGQRLKVEYVISEYSINGSGIWAYGSAAVVTKLIPVTEGRKLLIKSQNNVQFLYSWLLNDTNCSTGGAASIPSGYAARYIKNGSIIVDVPNGVKIIAVRADNNTNVYEPFVYELIESEDIKYTEFKELDTLSFTTYPYVVQTNGKWDSTGASTMIIPVESGWRVKLHTQTGYNSIYSILTSIDNISTVGSAVKASEGCAPRTLMDINSETTILIPSDAHYLGLRCDGNLLPSVSISKPIKEIVMSREDIEKMMTIDNRNVNFDDYPEVSSVALNSSGVWQNVANSISIFIPVTAGDTLTIVAPNDTEGVFYAMLTSDAHNYGDVNTWAEGWNARASLSTGESIDVVVPSDARYMWLWKSFQGNNLLPLSITSAMGVSVSYEAMLNGLQEQIDEINNAPHSEDAYFNQSDFSPLELVNRPLIYAADNKVNANHIVNAIAYPNGVIIAARSGGSIVRIDLDGTETTLLTINGSTDWRGLWMDSNMNVYASPFNGMNQDGSATNIGNGIYRMPYGGNSFTKVLTLSAGYCIWTFCEDNDGYLYAGNYQVITNNPLLYRSTDNGQTWSQIFDFRGSGLVPDGRHVHSVIFNRYNNTLYTIIGEVNEVYKSTDHGVTWEALGVQLVTKGSAMIDTPYGILVGSDGAYFCDIDLIYPDDKNHKRVSRAWADTIFAIRQSDISNNIYAFCKIDSSVKSSSYYPQMADVTDTAALQAWINSSPSQLASWQEYYDAMKDIYPDDAVRPQHFMILMSPDFGQTWKIIYREAAGAINADGFWTIGYFKNGECLAGRVKSSGNTRDFIQPIVISEGSHRYTTTGIDCEGGIFVRTCLTNIVQPL